MFGSKARGEATPLSDVDVLVVLDREEKPSKEGFYPLGLTNPIWREIVGMTFDFLMEYGVEISPTESIKLRKRATKEEAQTAIADAESFVGETQKLLHQLLTEQGA